jgi:membrane protein YqaA with SNARE-associated domain
VEEGILNGAMELLLDPVAWFLVVVLSALGAVAALSYYFVGRKGTEAVLSRFPRIQPQQWERARELYQEHGSGILFLSSLPVAGLVLATAAGAFGVSLATFFLWVLLGRVVRNWILFIIFEGTLHLVLGA